MKKLIYLFVAVAGLSLAGCDNFDYPNPPAQSNPQEELFKDGNLTMNALASGQTQNLISLNDAGKQVALAQVAAVEGMPEGFNLFFVAQVAGDESFGTVAEVETENIENTILANPDDLDAAYKEVKKTVDPREGTIYVRLKAYAHNGAQTVRLGGNDVYYAQQAVTVLPFKPDFTMEETYYLVHGDLSAANAVEMSNGGLSPYDFPSFSCVVTITDEQANEGYEWYIVPASTLEAGAFSGDGSGYGPADETAASGVLTGTLVGGKPAVGVTYVSGPVMFTANMKDLKFDYKLAYPCLYTPGNSNGWDQKASQVLFTSDYVHYHGFAHLDGPFKFSSQPDWNGTNFGAGESAGSLSTDGGAENLEVAENALYWCEANTVDLVYELTKIEHVALIGGFNDWNGDAELAPSADFLTWSGDVDLTAGPWKFRFNHDWAINLGGVEGDLVPGGDNLECGTDGTYTITLDLSKMPYSCTVVKK